MKYLEINRKDLTHNIKVLRKEIDTEIIAVVKGNGYGLGLVEFTKFLWDNGLSFFAVATVEEAIELRKAGIKGRILMLSSTAVKKDVQKLIDNNIILTVGSKEAIEVANELAKEPVPAHIKIDTGFGRYGFLFDDIETLVQAIKNNPNVKIEGCYSHFSNAYDVKTKWTTLQLDKFASTVENLKLNGIKPGMLHICNSSAALKYRYMWLNAVRIGSAFTGRILVPNNIGLKKIAKLKVSVSEVKRLPRGSNIGYSNTYKTKNETKVAIIPVGYMDGINMGTNNDCFRFIDHLRYVYNDVKNILKDNSMKVTINEREYKVIGKVGLYHITVDIGNDNIKPGDIATLEVKPLYIDSRIERKYV